MSIQSNFPNLKPSLLLDFANTKQLDNRVTFTRSTPAVYYDGKTTAMAEQNLLVQSQNSLTDWTLSAVTTTTSATTAPDGTSTAISVVPTTASTPEHFIYQSYTGTVNQYTYSVYAKPNGYNWVWLRPQIGGSIIGYASFNVSTGAIGSVSSGITATITSVGNGWYRCTATSTQGTGTNYFGVGVANTDGAPNFAGNGTSGAYLWGAQLEQRSSATAYTATTTQPITNYIPVLLTAGGNQPRFDCNPTTGESLGLLIEEQRTNRCTDSTSLLATGAATVSATATVAPDGSTNCRVIKVPSGYVYTGGMSNVVGGSTTWTYSFYIKNYGVFSSGTSIVIGLAGPTNTYRVLVSNLNTTPTTSFSDAVNCTNTSSTVTSVGNGWYRITATGTYSGAVDYNEFQFLAGVSGSIPNVFIWGMQLEAGAFATSYIPTTSASATRTADAASMTGANFSSWFNKGEGTIIYNTSSGQYIQDARLFWQLDNGISGYLQIFYASYAVNGNYYPPTIIPNGGTSTGPNLNAFAYNTTSVAVSTNGSAAGGGSGLTYDFSSAARFNFGATNIPISKMAFYPKKLTNTNLQALTS